MVEGKKIGTQIVLHERDDGKENRKNETRNLGLQSIIDREDSITAQLIFDASTQRDVAASIQRTIERLNGVISNLVWAANQIYNVIENAYMSEPDKTQKMIDILGEAYDICR